MKKQLLFLHLTLSLFAAETLVDALSDGNFTHKVYATYNEDTGDNSPSSLSRDQKMLLRYETAPIYGLKLEVATQALAQETQHSATDNTIYYTQAHYDQAAADFSYKLSANYYASTYHDANEHALDTTNALGVKAKMNYDNFSTYVAYSKVMDGSLCAATGLDGKNQLLPTSSLISSNTYAPNTQAYAVDANYALRKGMLIGSRYVMASDAQSTLSYTGVYSDFQLDELSKGLNIGVAYDKTGIDKQNDQFRLHIKSNF